MKGAYQLSKREQCVMELLREKEEALASVTEFIITVIIKKYGKL